MGELGEIDHGRALGAVVLLGRGGLARGQQVGDEVAVLAHEVGGDAAKAAAEQGGELLAVRPRAHDRSGVGSAHASGGACDLGAQIHGVDVIVEAAEFVLFLVAPAQAAGDEVELELPVLTHDQARLQGRDLDEVAVGLAGELDAELVVLFDRAAEGDGLRRAQVLAHACVEAVALLQALAQQLLAPQVANGQLLGRLAFVLEQGQAVAVGAGDRRLTVDDHRQHLQVVAFAQGRQLHTRTQLGRARQVGRVDGHRQGLA